MRRWFGTTSVVAAGMLALVAGPAAAQSGTIVGRITDASSGQPLVGARVSVIGTSLVTNANAEGRYRLVGVPLGEHTFRVAHIGYASINRTLSVVAVDNTLDVTLTATPFSLDEFVVTATGPQERREVGNAISTIEVANLVRESPIANMGDLLVGKAPGVQVLPGNLTGGGSRVRIRGNSSISLSNNPIYVVDGLRVVSDVNSSSIGIGGTNPSRVNDLNPEDIESIDVIRGPSASTLYGTDAANGVIVIKTKRGRAGAAQWNTYVEGGIIKDYNDYPTAYRGWRTGGTAATTSTASNTVQCLLNQVIAGTCTQDSVTTFNLFNDPDATPNGTGYRQQYGAQVAGGTESVRYFLSSDWEREIGQLRMPDFAVDRLKALRQLDEVPYDQFRPNMLQKANIRANVNATLGPKLDVAVSTGYVSSTQRLPQTDNNTTGLLSNAYGGPGFKGNIVNSGGVVRENFGYRLFTPDEFFSETVRQDINRTLLSGTANYRPTTWLSGRATVGADFISREDSDLCRRDECVAFATFKDGFRENNRSTFFNYTADANVTTTFQLAPSLGSKSTAGVQYIKEKFARNGAFAENLTPGSTTVSAGAIPSADETTSESITLGFFLEQTLTYKDRLFLTGAVRSDKNSAFGDSFNRVYYPKASVSYLLSEEPFFPKTSTLNSLRLRGAFGASGRQPGGNDALAFFAPTTASVNDVDEPAIVFSSLGNKKLKPERSEEWELGFDASFFNSKLNVEFTYYNKTAKDALLNRIIAPSVGTAASRFENIGSIKNKGVEFAINAPLINGRNFGWDLTVSGSYLSNKIQDLGGVAPIIGTTISQREGFPIDAYFLQGYTFTDANGDGLIALSELTVDPEQSFVGYSQPRGEFSVFTGVELFGRKLRITGLADAKIDGFQLNGTERIRCDSRFNCRGDVDPTAPLDEQARAVAVRQSPSRTQFGYVESAEFIRIREVAATYTLPSSWARALRANRLSITASGRNLAVFSGYSGLDPESGFFGTNTGLQSDFQTVPPPTYFTFKLNAAF